MICKFWKYIRVYTSFNLSLLILTVSLTGTFVNNETTSRLTNISSFYVLIFLITLMNSVESFKKVFALPTKDHSCD